MSHGDVNRVERVAPWCAGALFALPVLIVAFPPMADLPLHEASVGLLRHWGDPRFAPPSIYFVNLGHSNQLFSLLDYLLSLVMPIGWASKVVVAGTLLALPLAAARFADSIGAPRWTALLVAPLGFGWLFFWGLIQNIMGLVALLALLPAIDRFASAPTVRGALKLCGAMLLLHLAHQAMQLVACAAIAFASIGAPLTRRSIALRCVPIAFSLAVVYAATKYAWHFAGPVHKATAPYEYYTVGYKLETIPGVLFGGFEPYVRNLMMALAVVPVVFGLSARLRLPRSSTLGERLHAWRFELLALLLFALFLALPTNIKSTTLVYHRFLPPAWAVFAVSSAAGTRFTLRAVPRALCAVLPIASVLIAWPTFVDSHHIYSDLEVVMTKMEPGSTVAAINLGPDPRHRLWSPVVAMGHVVAEHGGRSLFDYSQSPISIVAQRPEKQWADPVVRLTGHLFDFRPGFDLERFRYLLVATTKESIAVTAALAMHDDAKLIAASGDWYLFESTHALRPIDSDYGELEHPYPPKLATLMNKIAKELKDEASRDAIDSAALNDLVPRNNP